MPTSAVASRSAPAAVPAVPAVPAAAPAMPRGLPSLMAAACGVTVANVYFPQAITPLVARGFGCASGTAAVVATVAQLGYAAGIFFLVPLGDRLPRRVLIVALLAVTALALLAAGAAPTLGALVGASALVGVTTVVPQLLIPMAAGLVGDGRRGAVIGTLQGGLIGGILLARTFGAGLGEAAGWRAPYLVAACLTVTLALLLWRWLPAAGAARAAQAAQAAKAPGSEPAIAAAGQDGPAPATASSLPESTIAAADQGDPAAAFASSSPESAPPRYPALLAQTLRLLAAEPALRRSSAYQATIFAGFSAVWTALALLLTGPAYRMGPGAVGVLALIGAVSMVTTPAAGRLVDRRGADAVNLVCLLAALAAAGVLALGAFGGVLGLAALVAGLVLIDVAVQGNQVANQARIMALRPEARARLNTGYMTCSFLGGSAGSALGIQAFGHGGWSVVCVLVAVFCFLALAVHAASRTVTAKEQV